MSEQAVQNRKVQTTIRLPRALYQRAKALLAQSGDAGTINDFFIAAVRHYLRLLERKRIDAAFAGMAEDAGYRKQAQRIADEFAQSDWEAFAHSDNSPAEA